MSSKKLKKDLQLKVVDTLLNTFGELKNEISPRKFKRNVRKASKALLAGLKISPKKESRVKKATPKKVAPKKKAVVEKVS